MRNEFFLLAVATDDEVLLALRGLFCVVLSRGLECQILGLFRATRCIDFNLEI